MITAINRFTRRIPVWAIWLAGAIPLALLVADTLTNNLGVDPVRDIEHRLGRTSLYLLIATLAVTPLLRLGRINLMQFRRALGLLCFTYAALHVAAWVVMDMGLLWGQMLRDIVKRPYLLFGMGAFVILLILAITSNNSSIQILRGNWRRLHRLIYPAAILALLHWLWSLKLWEPKPLFWLFAVTVLLALRVWFVWGKRRKSDRGSKINQEKTMA